MKKRLLALVMALVLIFSAIPVQTRAAAVYSGACGSNVTWELDSDGTLTIAGTGDMTDYDSLMGRVITPWADNISDITSIVIENGVTSIGNNAFYMCINAVSISIPDSVISIGEGAFSNCEKLEKINIPDSVTYIGMGAFYSCTSLTTIFFPASIETFEIGEGAFLWCPKLTSINVDSQNPSFASCDGILFTKDMQTLLRYPSNHKNTEYTVPDYVTSMESCAFYDSQNLTSVTIPGSISKILFCMFAFSDSLHEVNIGEGVTTIDDAFRDCTGLKSVTIPSSVINLYRTFTGCTGLTDVYYGGTEEQWNNNSLGDSDECIVNATIHYNCSNQPPAEDSSKWKKAYRDFIIADKESGNLNSLIYGDGDWADAVDYELIYLNNDEIPEIWITYAVAASDVEGRLLSYSDGQFINELLGEYLTYQKYNGKFDAQRAGGGLWLDTLYRLGDNGLEKVAFGSYSMFGENGKIYEDYVYEWNGASVTETQYMENISEWVDEDTALKTGSEDSEIYDYEGILKFLGQSSDESCSHVWGNHTITKQQTCTDSGEEMYTCALCGETKVTELLPLGHDYVDRTCARCGYRDFILKYDVWSFANRPKSFGPVSEGYYISNTDFQRLISNLPETERRSLLIKETEKKISDKGMVYDVEQKLSNYNVDNAFSDEQCVDWKGSCYGMSVWVCLNSYGIRKASDIDGFTSPLNLYSNRPLVESAINYYHFQQNLSPVILEKKEIMSKSQIEQIEILQKLGQRANETGKTFLVCYSYYKGFKADGSCDVSTLSGHAVVGYGWEEIEPRKIVVLDTNYTYNYCILIYDCADPENHNGNKNIYYNDDGIWCIPGKNMVSDDSRTADDRTDNANLEIVTGNASTLNVIDYITGDFTPLVGISTLSTATEKPYTVECNGYSASISGVTVESEASNHGIIATVNYNAATDDISEVTTTLILPDADSYTVTYEDDNVGFTYRNEKYLTSCDISTSGSLTFTADGTISASMNEPANYLLSLVADDGYEGMLWKNIEISGEKASEVSIEKAEDGLLLRSDNLNNFHVAVTSDVTSEIYLKSNEETVLLTGENGSLSVYEDLDGDGTYETEINNSSVPMEPEKGKIARLAGDNRFLTAIMAADAMKENLGVTKFDAVIVASGTNFADALSGSYLAAVKNAPILLSCNEDFNPNPSLVEKCNTIVLDYIRENLSADGVVYILGGPKAVTPAFDAALEGYKVKRLAGANRYETNIRILEEAGVVGKDVLICNGEGFADSLSASATELPILLVNSKYGLFDLQKPFLEGCDGKFYIIGGTSAVNSWVESQLQKYSNSIERIGGKDRFETSVMIAERFFEAPDSAVLAYAWNFPDGLCGGALAATMDAPLILTMDKYEARAAEYIQNKTIKNGFILGGETLISNNAVNTIFAMAE